MKMQYRRRDGRCDTREGTASSLRLRFIADPSLRTLVCLHRISRASWPQVDHGSETSCVLAIIWQQRAAHVATALLSVGYCKIRHCLLSQKEGS
jgi:hypothetical protein